MMTDAGGAATVELGDDKLNERGHVSSGNQSSAIIYDYPPDPELHFRVYTNDNTDESCEALIALKNIFSRQLPKMPKEYIVRLVFDRRHVSLAIIRQNRIVGGICYRPYFEQRFGEIAFCAINGTEQIRGYGTLLMNHVKHHVQKDKLEYFLTYADNFAIGYFQKQGFSKTCTMPKERWVGYIKDYDGGTLMECYIHPAMDYLNTRAVLAKQRSFIYDRIRERSRAGEVYPGLELFGLGKRVASVMEVPGVLDAGWTDKQLHRGATERDRNMSQAKTGALLKTILEKLRASSSAWVFDKAVRHGDRKGEDDVAAKNVDQLTLPVIMSRLKLGDFYRSREMLLADLRFMVRAGKERFAEGSGEADAAADFERVLADHFLDAGKEAAKEQD